LRTIEAWESRGSEVRDGFDIGGEMQKVASSPLISLSVLSLDNRQG
jgi:hypothetical protein